MSEKVDSKLAYIAPCNDISDIVIDEEISI